MMRTLRSWDQFCRKKLRLTGGLLGHLKMPLSPLHRIYRCRALSSGFRLMVKRVGAVVTRREMRGGEVQYTTNKNGGRLAYQKAIGTTPNVLYIPGLNMHLT